MTGVDAARRCPLLSGHVRGLVEGEHPGEIGGRRFVAAAVSAGVVVMETTEPRDDGRDVEDEAEPGLLFECQRVVGVLDILRNEKLKYEKFVS